MRLAPPPSRESSSSESSGRIEITISVPELKQTFLVNQPANGSSRLLLVCIKWRLSVGLRFVRIIRVEAAGEGSTDQRHQDVDGTRSYPDLGITQGSVVNVAISNGVRFPWAVITTRASPIRSAWNCRTDWTIVAGRRFRDS